MTTPQGAPQHAPPGRTAPAPAGHAPPGHPVPVYSSVRHAVGSATDSFVPLVAPLVPPGERLLGVVDLELSDLIRRVPRRHRPRKDGVLRVLFLLADLVGVVVELLEEAVFGLARTVRRLVRGRGLSGGWQSQAGRFAIAVLTGTEATPAFDNHDLLVVVTDRRILLAAEGRGQRIVRLGEVPREHLRRVELRLTAVSGRADAHFADGSRAALEVRARDAAALEALGRGAVPPPAAR
ncbi:hypothetical protein [Kitasatospora sp. NBC_01539]|uniref:hypothetical protein n=1 Tax=Kitasatospora sp. NBC_01539 TaxID=2903577 RepID=UPI0038603078